MAKYEISVDRDYLVVKLTKTGEEEFSYPKREVTYKTVKGGIELYSKGIYKEFYSVNELVDDYESNPSDLTDIIDLIRNNTSK